MKRKICLPRTSSLCCWWSGAPNVSTSQMYSPESSSVILEIDRLCPSRFILDFSIIINMETILQDIRYFPKCFFTSDNFLMVFSLVETSQMCYFPSGNLHIWKVPLGKLSLGKSPLGNWLWESTFYNILVSPFFF